MVEFRKVFLLLVVLVALTGIAGAQVTVNPLSCVANAGVPPLARAEGVAEEVGQVIIDCRGGNPTTAGANIPTINVQVFLNTNVTSRLITKNTDNSIDNDSEALLLIDEPLPGTQFLATANPPFATAIQAQGGGAYVPAAGTAPNMFLGQQAGANSIVWLNVPFDPPGTTRNRVLRIANVRANANQLGVSSTLIPTAINMFISISGTGSLALTNPQLTVAYVQLGLKFSASTANWNQCDPPLKSDGKEGGFKTYTITFAELFGTAFRHKDSTATGMPQDIPGKIYNTESMFYGPSLPSIVGVATQGTRLIARFSNVPANVSLAVDTVGATVSAGNSISLVADSGTDGSGNVTLTGGAGSAVWEIMTSNPGSIDSVKIPVQVYWKSSPQAGLGTATVTGNYAPTTTVFTASYSEKVPRFVDNPQSASTFTINSCKTNLLFPFLTNQAGFDSGIVISNTSLDPFSTVPQRGTCTLNYYGNTNGTGAAPGPQTSGTVTEGTQLVATLSGGGNLAIAATPGFQGYMIASCNFQMAHGFAFISDLGASRVAEGYLALIMDGKSDKFPRTGAFSEPLDN